MSKKCKFYFADANEARGVVSLKSPYGISNRLPDGADQQLIGRFEALERRTAFITIAS
jgi:hypothetical protein